MVVAMFSSSLVHEVFLLDPIVVLLGKDGANKPDDRFAVREDTHNIGASADLPVEPFGGVVGSHLRPDWFRRCGKRQDLIE